MFNHVVRGTVITAGSAMAMRLKYVAVSMTRARPNGLKLIPIMLYVLRAGLIGSRFEVETFAGNFNKSKFPPNVDVEFGSSGPRSFYGLFESC